LAYRRRTGIFFSFRQQKKRALHLSESCTFGTIPGRLPANSLSTASPLLNEQELIRGCLRGSAQCQRQLYEQFAGKMYAVCLRYARSSADAADILQEGFVKVFTKLDQFQFQGSFEGWVRRIMVNTALRTYQRQRFEFETSGHEILPESPVEPDALATLSEGELLRLISRLPDGYRVVFNMVAIEGYSHAEVAEQLGIQESTSRSQLTKARRWLCEQFETLHQITPQKP
jgi:RNA polymerase sigma factor (sigma-70 family)